MDPETGFVYLRNRYYDPEMGMFITADPLGFPDGPSPYAFGAGDPVNGRDPFGLFEGAEIRQRQYEAYRSGIDPMYMRGTADQIDHILADPRFQGTMQMLGGCSEAAVGALAAGGTAGLAAVPGGIAMLHGSDLCGSGYRTLRTGRYQEPLTVQGMQAALLRAGLPPTAPI
ncbi:MAG: RHS repeat-associated core domain-containing protein [Nitrospira sp.]|nr:RHS repeat-associated core domain-containing protein [Nitrospira sp.]